VCEPLLQVFPYSKHNGGGETAPAFSGLMFIYSSRGQWVFPPLLWSFPPTAAFTSFPTPYCWAVLLLLPATMFVYSSRGRWVFPPLLWSFPPSTTLTSFPAPGCCASAPTPSEPLWPGPASLFTVLGRFPFLPSLALSVPHPLCNVSLLFLLLIAQFLFFSLLEVGLFRGLCCSGPWLSLGVPHTT
jgi:hypothetical protein